MNFVPPGYPAHRATFPSPPSPTGPELPPRLFGELNGPQDEAAGTSAQHSYDKLGDDYISRLSQDDFENLTEEERYNLALVRAI